jgi:hypothetical protein
MPGSPEPLHHSLLRAGPVATAEPTSRWAYSTGGILLVSVFVLYHLCVLLVANGPGQDLAKPFHSTFLEKTQGQAYFRGTGNSQSWAMFAPNPDRTNNFIKVFVVDQRGDRWDFNQDIWGQNRYPYVWYDRRGKVNRNIDGKKHYQRIYGAWVCREWERTNAGEAPKYVRFVKHWTQVPEPDEVIANGGWDQWAAPHKEFEQETVRCDKAVHGTLPNVLRARYGLPLIDEAAEFRPVESKTWWDER